MEKLKKALVIILAVLSIASTLSLVAWGVTRTVKGIQMNFDCIYYLKRAADASTVEMAKNELAKAIEYAEKNALTEGIVSIVLEDPRNDVGFWYNNMKEAYKELDQLPENATSMEKTNVLMKLRESLIDEGSGVTHPIGISIYPNNVFYFWWAMISLIAACGLWFITYQAWYEWW